MSRPVVPARFRSLVRTSLAVVATAIATATAGPSSVQAAMPSTSGLGPRGGVVVVDLRSGATLLDRHGAVARIPASVTKLFTVGAALQRLGPAWTPETSVVATGSATGTTWKGDLYLVGGGDPTLTKAGLRALADRTAAALGVTRLDGRLLADASAFDDWRGGERTGRAPDYDMGGFLGALTVERGVQTTAPAARATSLFRSALRSAGVTVSTLPGVATAPASADPIAAVSGPTLAQLAGGILLNSDNFAAETLLKGLGSPDGEEAFCRRTAGLAPVRDPLAEDTGTGLACRTRRTATGSATTAGSSLTLRRTLTPLLGTTPKIFDGSGLTRRNRVSPALVARLLVRLNDDEEAGPVLRAALPRAGSTGTLVRRMRGTAAQGRCQAKTGTINGVSALAGFCHTKAGRDVAFAILQNGSSVGSAHRFQDRFVAQLAARG